MHPLNISTTQEAPVTSYVNETTEEVVRNDKTESNVGDGSLLTFRCFVVVIGVLGCFMNSFVLRALLGKRSSAQSANHLISNQILFDLLSSFFLICSYALKIPNMYLDGRFGLFLCLVFTSDGSVFALQAGSIANLVLIAAERYFKIVHSIVHRTHFRRWYVFMGISFTWISGILINMELLWTAEVIDGQCFPYSKWTAPEAAVAYGLFVNIWEFVVPLASFAYCYGKILLVVRRQNRIVAGNSADHETAPPNPLQLRARQSQMNVMMTMLLVSTAFIVCWFPNVVWYFLTLLNYQMPNSDLVYYASLLLIFLNVCLNPFIYVVKHNDVRKRMCARLRRNPIEDQTIVSVSIAVRPTGDGNAQLQTA